MNTEMKKNTETPEYAFDFEQYMLNLENEISRLKRQNFTLKSEISRLKIENIEVEKRKDYWLDKYLNLENAKNIKNSNNI